MKVKKISCPKNKYDLKCPYKMVPEFVVVHNTANDAPAENEISYMHRTNDTRSFHFAVDDVGAVQGIPLDRNAWHAGDGGGGAGNRKGIAVEICYSKSGGKRFKRSVCNGAALVYQLLCQYGWEVDRVKTHRDFSGKHCPHRILDDYGFSAFRSLVTAQGIKSGEQAARRLEGLGIIDAGYWIPRLGRIRFLDTLLVRASHNIICRGSVCPNTESAINALCECGVMNSPGYWKGQLEKDPYLPLLLRKLGGSV